MKAQALTSNDESPLLKTEATRYKELKRLIGSWWKDRLKVGAALREIRDARLYREEYSNFEDFCIAEYEIKHSQAYRLIEAAEVKESLETSPIGDKLTNEGQARALALVPPEDRAEVLEKASESGPVTAKSITEAARKAKEERPQLDKTGYPIPSDVLEDWQRAESFNDVLKQLHKVKLTVEEALKQSDPIFREVTNTTIADLKNAWSALARVLPFAVCPTCNGHNRKKCTLCKQRGFISKFGYERWIPKETKAIREKAIAK